MNHLGPRAQRTDRSMLSFPRDATMLCNALAPRRSAMPVPVDVLASPKEDRDQTNMNLTLSKLPSRHTNQL